MIKDKMQLSGFNQIKLPQLKGHIKLTLHNVHNGKNEIIEGENIVTNAVADIMSANYLGSVDYSKVFGTDGVWKKWFGGVLAYETAHPNLNANDYYPYADSNNKLIAHAGQTAIDPNHDDDLRRGNPTAASFITTENSIKQVWEWGTTHGNGTISAISLTHTDTGDYGLGSDTYGFKNSFVPLEPIDFHGSSWSAYPLTMFGENNVMAQYDESHALTFWLGELNSHAINTNSDIVSVYIRKLAYTKAGLFQTDNVSSDLQRAFEIETPIMFYGQPCYYFDYETKYLWLFSNMSGDNTYSKTNIDYCIIDCENESLVDLGGGVYVKTLVSDTENIAPLCAEGSNRRHYANLIKNGNDIYFPTASSPNLFNYVNVNGLQRIRLNSASQSTISFDTTARTIQPAMSCGDDFIIMPNAVESASRVINGENAYQCANQFTIWNDIMEVFRFSSPYKPSSYVVGTMNAQYTSATNRARYILANKLLNTTKYNLPSSVQKTPSQSMTVEYTLTEVEPQS